MVRRADLNQMRIRSFVSSSRFVIFCQILNLSRGPRASIQFLSALWSCFSLPVRGNYYINRLLSQHQDFPLKPLLFSSRSFQLLIHCHHCGLNCVQWFTNIHWVIVWWIREAGWRWKPTSVLCDHRDYCGGSYMTVVPKQSYQLRLGPHCAWCCIDTLVRDSPCPKAFII